MTRVGDELRRTIAGLFLTAAEAAGQRLLSMSLPATAQVTGSVVKAAAVGQWSVSEQVQSINTLRIPQAAARIAPWLSETELAQVGQRAAELADFARETLPFWAVFGGRPLPVFTTAQNITDVPPPEYSTDPAGWVARFILLPALQHHLTA